MLYVFSGRDSYIGVTPEKDGANLPVQHGPWKPAYEIKSDDPRLEQGMGKGTGEEIAAHGFSLRRIAVVFEPPTAVPEQP
jgi:hypothetical protein